jgi:2'-5' RNA ligase
MIRAFIAVKFAPEVLECIADALEALRPAIPDIRWIPSANWHLTLKFLGAIDEQRVDAIVSALERDISLFPQCTINAKGLGIFQTNRPRVLWVGVEGMSLGLLAQAVERAIVPLGFEPETRAFAPHLTIGRWREGKRRDRELQRIIEQWRLHDFGASKIETVELYQSVLNRNGAQYRALNSVRLKSDLD